MKDATQSDRDQALADLKKQNPTKQYSEEDISRQVYNDFYKQAFAESGLGTGGKVQQAIQAATAAVQGLAGGDFANALAGGSAPYLAEVIHTMTTNPATGKVKTEANLMAHAVVGAVVAQVQGNSALAGASGAAMGEFIAQQLYPGIKREDLSEAQRQTISALGTLAAGLAGGLTGDSTADAVAGGQAGRNSVENNLLGGNEESQAAWIRQHGVDMASCADAPGSSGCQKAMNERDAVGLALATGSVALLPGGAQAMWGLGAGANAGISYLSNGTIDPANAAIAGWVNVISMGNGLTGTVGWNAAGGALGNWIDDRDPLSGAITNGVGAGIGYGIGKGISGGTNSGANWWQGGWDPKFNSTLQKYTEIKGDFSISKEMTPSNSPGLTGDIGGGITSELGGKYTEKKIKQEESKK